MHIQKVFFYLSRCYVTLWTFFYYFCRCYWEWIGQ